MKLIVTESKQRVGRACIRRVYRVHLPNGTVMTIPELANKLRLPRSTIQYRLFHGPFSLGQWTTSFQRLIADLIRERDKREQGEWQSCPHCKGSGRVRNSTFASSPPPGGDTARPVSDASPHTAGDSAHVRVSPNVSVDTG